MAMMKLPFLLVLAIAFLTPRASSTCPCTKPKPTPPTGGGPLLPPLPTVPLPPVVPKVPPVPIVTPIPPLVPVISPILPKPPVVTPVLPKPPAKSPPGTGCSPAPPKKKEKCPIDVVKLGVCLDVLGSTIHLGDPKVDCCPLIAGLTSDAAALCLCTTIKLKVLGVKVFMPIAVELLVTCGKTPPPGYSCS